MFEPFPPIGAFLYEYREIPKFKPWRMETEVLQAPIHQFESAYNYVPDPEEVRAFFEARKQTPKASKMIEGLTRVQKGNLALEAQFLYNVGEDLLFDECRFIVFQKPPPPQINS